MTGYFQDPILDCHIAIKETEGAIQGILAHNMANTQLHLYTDNSNLFWAIKRWGSKSLQLNQAVRTLWQICHQKEISLVPHWVPSEENLADQASRRKLSPYFHSMLNPSQMLEICQLVADPRNGLVTKAFKPMWDWMATPLNTQLPKFVGEEQNFFLQDLSEVSPGWLNPPWGMIPHILNYWACQKDTAQALVCLPHQPYQAWWPLAQKMVISKSVILSPHRGLILEERGDILPAPRYPLWLAVLQGLNLQQAPLMPGVPIQEAQPPSGLSLLQGGGPQHHQRPLLKTASDAAMSSREQPLKRSKRS